MSSFSKQVEEYIQTEESDLDKLKEQLNNLDKLLESKDNYETLGKMLSKNNYEALLEKKEEVSVFWRKIDLQIIYNKRQDIQEYNFRGYYFPKTIESSFLALRDEDNKIVFDKGVAFHKAHFLKEIKFNEFIFTKKVSFNDTHFYDRVELSHCRFEGETYLRKTIFDKEVDFNSSRFEKVTFDNIVFPSDPKDKIKMDRVTLVDAIWSEFNSPLDVQQIEAKRETLASFKKTNADRGNYIDSNLFFVQESEVYLAESWQNLKKSSWRKKPSLLADWISFRIAKFTSNYGQSWMKPLKHLFVLFILSIFMLTPNKDYFATVLTPIYALRESDTTIKVEDLNKYYLEKGYYKNNYYLTYYGEFQEQTNKVLKNNLPVKIAFFFSCLTPNIFADEQLFVTIEGWTSFFKILLSIFMWYFLGAFIFALKNRTKRV